MPEKTALILTGGDGLRLRPLTCTKPKAMLPVCGVPLISYTLNLLEQHFSTAYIAADRLSNVITDYLDDASALDFIISSVPEGTCRPIAETAKVTEADTIAVIFGDLLFDMDFQQAAEAHTSSGSDITIVTAKTDRPSRCTLAVTEGENVTEIITDPARENCRSDLAVTGVFFINRKTALLAENYTDLLTELIPAVIRQHGKVTAFTSDGIFVDLNTPDDLFTANKAVLSGAFPHSPENIVKKASDYPELDLSVPALIPHSADIAPHVKIGADTVIGENVTVCRGAKINGAIIMDGAYIGERATVNHAIIGTGARLLTGASAFEGAVIGDSAVLAEQAAVQSGVKIWNGRHLDSYACAAQDIKYGFLAPMKIGDDGICGETGSVITPQTAASAGSALASLGAKIGVGYKDTPASKSLALAVASGITAAGSEAWLFGVTTAPALAFCTEKSGLSAGCWVDAGITAKLQLFSGDGLPLTRSEEKIIEGGINRSEYKKAGFMHFGALRDTSAIVRLYRNMLEKTAPKPLKNTRAVLNTSGTAVTDMCEDIFRRISAKEGKPLVFHIGSDGTGVSAYTEETGYVFEEKLMLICCKQHFSLGHDIALPYHFPMTADKIAEKYGCKVFRYSGCPSDKSDSEARKLALKTPFVRDGAALALTVLETLESRGITLAEAVRELPEMALATRFVAVDKHPMKLLKSLTAEKQASGDGITLNDARGRVLIRPVKTEKGVIMQAESFSMETASELCDFYQDILLMRNKANIAKRQ